MKTPGIPLLALLMVMLAAARPARAGTTYEIRCLNKSCGYHGAVDIGGSMMVEEITGYCYQEHQFAELDWWRADTPQSFVDRHAPPPSGPLRKAPTPVKIWSPLLGRTLSLYKCPTCPCLFLPIKDPSEIKFCPKCHEATLELTRGATFD